MINMVFSKMEAYSGNFGISLRKLQQRQKSLDKARSLEDELSVKQSEKSGSI